MTLKSTTLQSLIKKNKALLGPFDILSIVLFAATLAFAYSLYTTFFQSEIETSSQIHLYANEIAHSFYDSEIDESRITNIRNQCQGLASTNLDESYFLEKHCDNEVLFYNSITAGLFKTMEKKYSQDRDFQNYISNLKEETPRCREFYNLHVEENNVKSIIASEIFKGNAVFITPNRRQYYSACSDFRPGRGQ